jgi:hypothetical protein
MLIRVEGCEVAGLMADDVDAGVDAVDVAISEFELCSGLSDRGCPILCM